MSRRRVAILAKYFPPDTGGMELYVHGLADALKRDFEVHVVAFSQGREGAREQWDGFEVHRCGVVAKPMSQPISLAYLPLVRSLAPDIVNLHAPNVLATPAWKFCRNRPRLIVSHQAEIVGRAAARALYRPLYHAAIAAADRVIVMSLNNARLSRDLPDASGRLVELPVGLDPDSFVIDERVKAEGHALRRRLAGDAPVIGFVGRIVPYKGLDVLARALARLPGVHAIAAGEGPARADVEESARRAGVADRLHLLGPVDERTKLAVYAAADLFALPSLTVAEAFGIVQVEAQFCGLPVVASDLPTGVTDVTVGGETGLLSPPGDDSALAANVARLLRDPAERRRLGDNGRRRAMERFSKAAFERRAVEIFASV